MKTALFVTVVIMLMNALYCTAGPVEETTTTTGIAESDVATAANVSDKIKRSTLIDLLKGRDGRDGLPGLQGEKGEQGPPGPQGIKGDQGVSGGGAVYTRWGRTVCPNTNGTTLVYQGLAAGSDRSESGGGANYLCITEKPTYLSSATRTHSFLYGGEYKLPLFNGLNDHNVPCAVCYTSQRSTTLMIPGETSCPSSWTQEYNGYLMAEYYSHKHNDVYECVDKDAESVPGQAHRTDGALFYHVSAKCKVGLPCPPFVANRPITCAVCTK